MNILDEYSEIFSDVPRVTHLIEHKVELTETEPVKHKPDVGTLEEND